MIPSKNESRLTQTTLTGKSVCDKRVNDQNAWTSGDIRNAATVTLREFIPQR